MALYRSATYTDEIAALCVYDAEFTPECFCRGLAMTIFFSPIDFLI